MDIGDPDLQCIFLTVIICPDSKTSQIKKNIQMGHFRMESDTLYKWWSEYLMIGKEIKDIYFNCPFNVSIHSTCQMVS